MTELEAKFLIDMSDLVGTGRAHGLGVEFLCEALTDLIEVICMDAAGLLEVEKAELEQQDLTKAEIQ